MEPTLLCVAMEPGRVMRLSLLALSMGIQVKEIKEESWGQPLGALCGLDQERSHPPRVKVGEEMLVFAFLPDDMLDNLLPALRSAGLGVRLKAMLTPTNRNWNCGQLYQELKGEAAAFEQRK